MFTGIVAARGSITAVERRGDAARMKIRADQLGLEDVALGDSIAVDGACLTVVDFSADDFTVDVSSETLHRTTLHDLGSGDRVNLEKALRLKDRLGGHLVTGHVDGVGTVRERHEREDYVEFVLEAPESLARYIAEKGSICVAGVSLTVNKVRGSEFSLLIIPHTLQVTTLGDISIGAAVNLEIDIICRYLERMITWDAVSNGAVGDHFERLLDSAGFVTEQ